MKLFKLKQKLSNMRVSDMLKSKQGVAVAAVGMAAVAQGTLAIVAPAAGSFAYDLYDVGVNDILQGAPGFIAGMAAVIWSATKIQTDWKQAGLGILGGTALIRADDITTSLGVLVPGVA